MAYQEDIENSIITQLTPLISSNLQIVPLPENEADYLKPLIVNRVTVMYFDSEYGDSDNPVASTGIVVQAEKVFIEITIESKRLRGNSGVYTVWNAIKGLLLGFTPTDCDRLRLLKFGIDNKGKKDTTWAYCGILYCTRLEVQKDTEDVYPLIKQINFDYESI